MKKSTIVATCLVNSNMINRMEDAECRVRQVFKDDFPKENFDHWNSQIDENTAGAIIRNVGRASRINVKKFIEDLWKTE